MKPLKILSWFASMAFLVSACTTPILSAPISQPDSPLKEQPVAASSNLREIGVEDAHVEIGRGSPIPINVVISGTWPGLCSQMAEIKQTTGDHSFDIHLLATSSGSSCPPDPLGLPFGIEIPLNMAEKPFGTYTVTVNGWKTTFDWKGAVSIDNPTENRFIFEGVSFVPDSTVSTGAAGNLVPEKLGSADSPYWEIKPEHIRISLDGYPLTQTTLKPVIAVYPVADYRKLSDLAGKNIDSLMDLLAHKPADVRQMPFLPIENAGQVFHSNVQYLDFRNGSGVRYLTILAQYPAPVNNQDLFYTYQGLTADGRHYVSIILPVNHPFLPVRADALSIAELEGIAKDRNYYPEMSAKLSALPDSGFTPDLAKLDAIVASLAIER